MPDSDRLRVAVIIGSTRKNRFGSVPARWFANQARQREDFEIEVIDLRAAELPAVLTDDDEPDPEPVQALSPRLAAADAFVVVTPVYNRGYPAALKNAIDWYFDEWSAKPVAFVSYGGTGGGLHSIEQLRQVFNEVHATTLRDTVSFHNYEEVFNEEGEPIDADGVNGAAKTLLDQLAWWAHALRDARRKHPFNT